MAKEQCLAQVFGAGLLRLGTLLYGMREPVVLDGVRIATRPQTPKRQTRTGARPLSHARPNRFMRAALGRGLEDLRPRRAASNM